MSTLIKFDEALDQYLIFYRNKLNSTEKNYRQDLKLVYKIEKEIKKILVNTGNPRILINYTVIFLNSFGTENGWHIISSMIKDDIFPQIKTILFVLGAYSVYNGELLDSDLYNILEKELQ